jgi:hypothetical protein
MPGGHREIGEVAPRRPLFFDHSVREAGGDL